MDVIRLYTHTHTNTYCVWLKKTGFISIFSLTLESQPLLNTTMSAQAAAQRGLVQVLGLSMFQLSEFFDKRAGATQCWPTLIHAPFNFTLPYITPSPKGRISSSDFTLKEKASVGPTRPPPHTHTHPDPLLIPSLSSSAEVLAKHRLSSLLLSKQGPSKVKSTSIFNLV